jgi:hypothetical protein
MALDDYVAPVFLTDQAKNLNDSFYLTLDELVKSYPEAKLHPSENSVKDATKTNLQYYNAIMLDMMNLQNKYFMYKNSIAVNSQGLIAQINDIDDKINVLDADNLELKRKINEMANSSQSAEGMLDDRQITRNQVLMGNIILFIIMATGGFFYYKKVIKKT